MDPSQSQQRIEAALKLASDTRVLRLGRGAVRETGEIFRACFGSRSAVVVADANTFAAAGRDALDALVRAGVATNEPIILDDPELHADYRHVEHLQQRCAANEAVPVAAGSGTINDLTKLAAHLCGRGYMAVATAASMDGYTAYGASITRHGWKQTIFCPAPVAVIADLDVISASPGEMNAAGYADLIAKVPAGADWMIADALGVEPIDPQAWSMVQDALKAWVARPDAVRRGDFDAIAGQMEGLLMTGFAMQWCKSSRPASGAEHQFSHLWDMQGHRYDGRTVLHGFKVAIGTLASTRLYEELLQRPLELLDIDGVCRAWPDAAGLEDAVIRTHELEQIRTVARQEMKAKYVSRDELAARLGRLQSVWPELRRRLQAYLIPADALQAMLREAGAPETPAQIGIDLDRLRRSYYEAQQIRRRFTVLDLAMQTGLMDDCIERLFAPDGAWTRAVDR
ncbi:MAG TPA: sn-glycerol-1-phosphate dehydrogenase [Phycisphaerae bacterium]|nr:sn-glycerol-1-phosphate dehydrogenase [Phycisphaerae bacterium]HPP25475.1 sn-glycerol-1-phosphate dehydrogenase [Phycisphaerae bacterium]HPZ97735.1 sn-glycerol-1-phosphate dehydrogenase [Phycisphaerae bacterium]